MGDTAGEIIAVSPRRRATAAVTRAQRAWPNRSSGPGEGGSRLILCDWANWLRRNTVPESRPWSATVGLLSRVQPAQLRDPGNMPADTSVGSYPG